MIDDHGFFCERYHDMWLKSKVEIEQCQLSRLFVLDISSQVYCSNWCLMDFKGGAFLTSTCVKELLLPIACSGTPPKANIAEVLSSFSCFTLKLPFAVICIYFHQLTKHGTFVSFSCKPQLLAVWLSMLESVSFLSSCSAFWGASIALSTRTFKKKSMSSGEATHTKPCFWVWWKF